MMIIRKSISSRFAALAALACTTLSAAAADTAPPACQYAQVARLPLHYTGPGLGITMDGTIDGTPALMLADTGSDQTWLTRTATEKRGLRLHRTATEIEGVGGRSRMYAVKLDDFSAGPAKSSKGWVPVIGDTGGAPGFEAIVGAPYLLQTDMELALADKEIRFFRPVGCSDAQLDKTWLAYWDRNAVVIPFERNVTSGKAVNPRFTIEVNGAKMEAIIDSGASLTSIDARAARRAGIEAGGPDTVAAGYGHGIGARRIAHWRARVATLKVGDETIRDAEVDLMDTRGRLTVDVLLGADFLRAHRVLFAMSQRRLYLSYIGGDVLGKRQPIAPWIQQEADAGNPDAQLVLAKRYHEGKLVPRDEQCAAQWLEKAAAQGHAGANLVLARRLMASGDLAGAVARLAPALRQLPAERHGALWLYELRVRAGAADSGRRELEAAFARGEDNAWPRPVADYALGRIDAQALLAAAQEEGDGALRACQASRYIAEWRAAQAGAPLPAELPEDCPSGP